MWNDTSFYIITIVDLLSQVMSHLYNVMVIISIFPLLSYQFNEDHVIYFRVSMATK